MVQRELEKEDGFTVAELLITLTIVSIVVGITGSVFVFIGGQMSRWRSNIGFYNNYSIVQERVYKDVLRADSFNATDTSLVIQNSESESKVYQWGSSGIMVLNQHTELTVHEVDSLILEWKSDIVEPQLARWSIDQQIGTRKFRSDFTLAIRKPVQWNPIPRTSSGGN